MGCCRPSSSSGSTKRKPRASRKRGAVQSSKWSSFTDLSDLFSADERSHGIHAGEVETSVMLYLHPELVDMTRAEDFVPLSKLLERQNEMLMPEGGAVGFGWQMQDIHPKGACGNASLADAARGRIAVERAADRLNKLIAEIAAYPLGAGLLRDSQGGMTQRQP